MSENVLIGKIIMIVYMVGEKDYQGKTGTVTHIDGLGQLHGTWGGLAIVPGVDKFITINKEEEEDDVE